MTFLKEYHKPNSTRSSVCVYIFLRLNFSSLVVSKLGFRYCCLLFHHLPLLVASIFIASKVIKNYMPICTKLKNAKGKHGDDRPAFLLTNPMKNLHVNF